MTYSLASAANAASCDLQHGRPVTLERDNDGSYIFTFNVTEHKEIPEGKSKAVLVGYDYREVRFFGDPNKKNIKKAIIRATVSETEEFALINAYNMAMMNIVVDENAIDEYDSYLHFINDIDIMLNELNIA